MNIDLSGCKPCPGCRQCLTTEPLCSYCNEREQLKAQLAASQAQNAVLREALGKVGLTFECPNAGDPSYGVDYGIGHGHICDLCSGTGEVAHPWYQAVTAATPAASLAMVKAGALREAANLIRQTTPMPAIIDGFSHGRQSGRHLAIEQIEGMADQLEAAAKGEKDA